MGDSVANIGKNVTAVESIFLGKKSYIDRIQDENGNQAFHIRQKGIPSKCLQFYCDQQYEANPFEMYLELFQGEAIDFELSSGGNCLFRTGKDHLVSTGSMTRRVCFADPGLDVHNEKHE